MKSPANAGATAHAPSRTRCVIPDASVRSSGLTTAMTYDWRVGTSISTSPSRRRNSPAATGKLGAKGTVARRRLDGMCVKTIVFTSPIRLASQAAAMCESAFMARAPKKSAPTTASLTWNRS